MVTGLRALSLALLIDLRLQTLDIFEDVDCYFWCPNLSFGITGRSRGAWEHKKGHLGMQALIFIDFERISGTHFESFSGTSAPNMCLFSC